MLEIISQNWQIIIFILLVICSGIFSVFKFLSLDKKSQIKKLQEWLFYAVYKAEEEFASGTGKLKLHYVYDMAITKFPDLTQVISFEDFMGLVDDALKKFEAWQNQEEENINE